MFGLSSARRERRARNSSRGAAVSPAAKRPFPWVGRLLEAIDLKGTSCDREAYRRPSELLSAEWPAVGSVTPEALPTGFAPTKEPPTWEFFAVDDPEEANEAHCEIRIRRGGQTSDENDTNAIKKRPTLVREALKAALAGVFRVLP